MSPVACLFRTGDARARSGSLAIDVWFAEIVAGKQGAQAPLTTTPPGDGLLRLSDELGN